MLSQSAADLNHCVWKINFQSETRPNEGTAFKHLNNIQRTKNSTSESVMYICILKLKRILERQVLTQKVLFFSFIPRS